MIIPGATKKSYTTKEMKEPGIIYYYAVVRSTIQDNGDRGVKQATTKSPLFSVAYTGLPTLFIQTNHATLTKEAYTEHASFTLISSDKELIDTDMKIKGRGNTSWDFPKQGYSIKLDHKEKVLGLPKDKKWVLTANYTDKTLLRNQFIGYLDNTIFTNMSWNPSFKSIDFVLDGVYKGTYIIGEKPKLSDKRVDVQDMSDIKKDSNGDSIIDIHDGGFLVEFNARQDEDFNFITTHHQPISLKDPDDKEDVTEEMFSYTKNIIQTAEDALFSDQYRDEETGYAHYFDVPSLVDWYVSNELVKNLDSNDLECFGSVYMFYDPQDGKLHMGPNWDFDLACGNTPSNNCYMPTGFWVRRGILMTRLFQDNHFRMKVRQRWDEIKEPLYQAINNEIQAEADEIQVSQTYNFQKWPVLGQYVWPSSPTGFGKRDTYTKELNYLINWLNERYTWMDENLPTT